MFEKEVTEDGVAKLVPGVQIRNQQHRIRDWLVIELLHGAVDAGLFEPFAVTAWEARGADKIPSICLTINLGDGVQLAAPVWTVKAYTHGDTWDTPREGRAGAVAVIKTARKAVRYAAERYYAAALKVK